MIFDEWKEHKEFQGAFGDSIKGFTGIMYTEADLRESYNSSRIDALTEVRNEIGILELGKDAFDLINKVIEKLMT